MIEFLIRNLKRFIVLIPGVLVALWSAQHIYPFLDKRIPAGLAIFLTYAAAAYLLVPLSIRLVHLVVRPRHIPLYSTTPDGFACDPINIGVIATEDELKQLMKRAGWYHADARSPRNLLRFLYAMILKKPYPSAPFSSLYLFGRKQDLGFQLPVSGNPRHRHHVRFWGVTDTDDPEYRQHTFFWLRHHHSPEPGKLLWVGAASLDTGIGIIRHNAQVTHMIHHDTNAEREFIIGSLRQTKRIKRTRLVTVGAPYQLRNRVLTGYMLADGKMKICEL